VLLVSVALVVDMVVERRMPLVLVGQVVVAVQTQMALFPERLVIHLQPLLCKVEQVALELPTEIRIALAVVVAVLVLLAVQALQLGVATVVLG
jgi:hypothetical protein